MAVNGNTWGDKSVGTFIEGQKQKIFSDSPATPGFSQNQALVEDEKSRLAAREKFGMPTVGAASMTGAPVGTAGSSGQASLAERLKAIAAGGPTAGQQAMYANNDAAKRAMMASAFGKPGGAAGMRAARTMGNQAAYMDATAARQADIIGAQEQQAAMSTYGQLGAAMRSADIAAADEANRINMANAGFAQSSALANQDAALRWQAMNDAQKRALLGMGVDLNQQEWANRLGRSSAEYDAFSADRAMKNAQDAATREKYAQGLNIAIMGATAGMKGGA